VIAWDPPGQGKSIPPERVYTKDWLEVDADIVAELMKVLKISTFDVLGWANGGITAIFLAAKHPEMVEKMVIFGTTAYLTQRHIASLDHASNVNMWADHIRMPKEKLYGFAYLQKKYKDYVDMAKKIYKENEGNFCRQFLKDIKAKTLIVHGEMDVAVSREEIAYLLENIADSKVIGITLGSNDIHVKFPEEFNNHVADFLK
jgi:valacyclovir hydrolase